MWCVTLASRKICEGHDVYHFSAVCKVEVNFWKTVGSFIRGEI